MPRLTATLVLGGVLATAACHDAPTAPPPTAVSDTARTRVVSNEFSDLMDALQDVRTRVLPALGDGPKQRALATAVSDLGRMLAASSAPEVDKQLVAANAAAEQLRADTTIFADVDVVLLTLDRIFAVRHPIQSGPPMTGRSPDARREQ